MESFISASKVSRMETMRRCSARGGMGNAIFFRAAISTDSKPDLLVCVLQKSSTLKK